jgi:hypothetical protein
MNNSFAGRRKRYHREYYRDRPSRHVRPPDTRSGSRHKVYPCCGKRRAQCVCDWTAIEHRLDPVALSAFVASVGRAGLLKVADTHDTNSFLEKHRNEPCLVRFLTLAVAYRRFNRPATWDAIEPCFATHRVNWKQLEKTLSTLFDSGAPVFGGVFYAPTLRRFSTDGGNSWQDVPSRMPQAAREALTVRLLIGSIPVTEVRAYIQSPSRETFAAWYDSFLSGVAATTKGCFAQYNMKLVLDLVTCSGHVPCHHLARWPIQCPGYQGSMARLFPGLPQAKWLQAFYYLYKSVGPSHGLRMAEVLMQLCWEKRRAAGTITDQSSDACLPSRMGGVSPRRGPRKNKSAKQQRGLHLTGVSVNQRRAGMRAPRPTRRHAPQGAKAGRSWDSGPRAPAHG